MEDLKKCVNFLSRNVIGTDHIEASEEDGCGGPIPVALDINCLWIIVATVMNFYVI
jgi:hypothetical protein